MEVFLDGIFIDETVIYTIFHIFKVSHDLCFPVGVSITSTYQALWGRPISITAPGGDKSCQGAISWVEGDTGIPVPAVNGTLDFVTWYGGDNCPGGLRVVCLSRRMSVERGEVHHAAGSTLRFGADDQ